MSLLITAFGRFDGGPNCSEALLAALAGRRAELEAAWRGPVALLLLDVDTVEAPKALGEAVATHRPTHLLLMGQAGGRAEICLERVARNLRDFRTPDVAGREGPLGPVRAGGPYRLDATWPALDRARDALAAQGLPVRVSDDAGAHLCNQTLYWAIEAGARADPPFVATFLHLPLLPEQVAAGVPAAGGSASCPAIPLDEMARAVLGFVRHTRDAMPALRAENRMTGPRRRWTEMTTEDFSRGDVGRWIAVLPVAAVEQHGPHLPLGVDAMIADFYLARVEALIPDGLPVTFLPVQTIGASAEHLAFPGTLSLSPETALKAWIEIGASIARAGVKKLVIVNSHGGNSGLIDLVARELRVAHGMFVVTASWRRFGYPDGLFSDEETRHGIHAGAIETSLMRAFRPDLVRMEKAENFVSAAQGMEREFSRLRAGAPTGFGWMSQDLNPSGALGDASAASDEAGEASAEHGARAFVQLLQDVDRFDLARLTDGPPKA